MNRYVRSIENVKAYIDKNLSQKISLDELAEVSNFSKYHFSRIFNSIVGVTPYAYIKGQRLKNAIKYLTETDRTITDISSLCGFESISNFNSIFKQHFQKTPSEVRRDHFKRSNIQVEASNIQEAGNVPSPYYGSNNSFLRRIWQMNINVRELPNYKVAYVRHVGSYLDTHVAWSQLGSWAGKNNLFPPTQWFIGISLDDPATTEEYACRYDACVTIPEDFPDDGSTAVQYQTLAGGLYAQYPFYDTIDKFAIAYQVVYGQWLPSSEYDPDDRYCLEFCMNNPLDDPEGKAKIDLYVPIKKRV